MSPAPKTGPTPRGSQDSSVAWMSAHMNLWVDPTERVTGSSVFSIGLPDEGDLTVTISIYLKGSLERRGLGLDSYSLLVVTLGCRTSVLDLLWFA